ncbi:MAG: polysaccharide biosynthesis tyrosine autokinase [Thermosynechococcaceae cyanobacterium]
MPKNRSSKLSSLRKGNDFGGDTTEIVPLFPTGLYNAEDQEGGLDLGQLFSVLRRRWLTITVITVAVASATLWWSKTRDPIYIGEFQILIEPVTAESEVVSAIAGESPDVQSQGLGNTQASKAVIDYPTQIQVLQSRKLLTPVVEKMETQLPGLTYEQLTAKLEIGRLADGKQETKILQVNYQGDTAEEVELAINALSQNYIDYSLNERQTNLKRALQFVDAQLPKVQFQVRQLESSLQALRERYSLVDPETLNTQVAGQIAGVQKQELDNQIQLLQTRRLYSSLQSQLQLQPNAAEAGSVLTEAPGYQEIATKLRETETKLAVALAELTPDHPTVIALQEERDELRPLLTQQAKQALGTRLFNEIDGSQVQPYQDSLRKNLSSQLVDASIQMKVLETQRQVIANSKTALAQQMKQLPAINRQYETLQRQLEVASTNLKKFLEKKEELQLNAARQEVPWELVGTPALSQEPASAARDLILGTMLGMLLGVGTAILLDRAGDVIHRLEDLRSEVRQPILGLIPLQNNVVDPSLSDLSSNHLIGSGLDSQKLEDQMFRSSQYGFSPFLESFRSLASQVRLLDPDSPVMSLAISSSLPNEGKTTVAVHLAKAAAALGQRVLLVDADLRSPSLGNVLGLPLSPGLSDIIATELSVETAIHTLPNEENLSILTSGIPPVDPTRCLASQKMKDLCDGFADKYDLIIYDTPPLGLADVMLLGVLTDGLIVVTRLGVAHRTNLKNKLNNIATSNVPIWGIVANGVKGNQISSSIPDYGSRTTTAA